MQKDSLILLKKVASKLLSSGILPKESYLAGGTAAYFYLNHRISFDLHFFFRIQFCVGEAFFSFAAMF